MRIRRPGRLYAMMVMMLLGVAMPSRGWSVDEQMAGRALDGQETPKETPVRSCADWRRIDCRGATRVSGALPLPLLDKEPEIEAVADETLADALEAAYRTAPSLQAERYRLRSDDEDYARALAELRPFTRLDVTGDYARTVPGRATQVGEPSSTVTDNSLRAQLTLTQPLYTGGRASAGRDVALAGVAAGRAQLRSAEGDIFLQVITAYADVRRDQDVLRLRSANLKQLQATLAEVKARREAGELTRTDIAQAENQLALAQLQYSGATQQWEQDRATYAALVGHAPGILAPLPGLPILPASMDVALDMAQERSPDLEQAVAAERASRAEVAVAGSEGKPTVMLQGSAALYGRAIPYYSRDQDQQYSGQAVLTIPLTAGGRVASSVARARDRNIADLYGIDFARRQVVSAIVQSWSAINTTRRNVAISEAAVASARILDEGTFEEYRAGLRSTFDVLFAHGALRDAEIGRVNALYGLYVSAASLLRRVGTLDAAALLPDVARYDPQVHFRRTERRNALPWDGLLRAVDGVLPTRPAPDPMAGDMQAEP